MSDHPKVLDTMKKLHLLLCPNKQDFLHKLTRCLKAASQAVSTLLLSGKLTGADKTSAPQLAIHEGLSNISKHNAELSKTAVKTINRNRITVLHRCITENK